MEFPQFAPLPVTGGGWYSLREAVDGGWRPRLALSGATELGFDSRPAKALQLGHHAAFFFFFFDCLSRGCDSSLSCSIRDLVT